MILALSRFRQTPKPEKSRFEIALYGRLKLLGVIDVSHEIFTPECILNRFTGNAARNSIPPYRNPASPEILQASRSPWDTGSGNGTPTGAHSTSMSAALLNSRYPQNSSESSLSHGFRQQTGSTAAGGSANSSAPVLPLADTYAQSSSISHSTGGTTGTSLNGNDIALSPSVPSTARTSFDSVVMTGAGASATQPLAHQRLPSSGPPPPSRARSTSDVLSTVAKVSPEPGTGTGVGVSIIPTPSPSPHVAVDSRNAGTASIVRDSDGVPEPDATSPVLDVGSGPGTAVPAGGGSGPVNEGTRTQREG